MGCIRWGVNLKILIKILLLFITVSASAGEFEIKTKEVLKKELQARTLTLDEWVGKTNNEHFDLLCLGESHENFFRDFYGKKVFSKLKVNTLALEAVEKPVVMIYENYVERIEGPNLITGVDINPVIYEALALNPKLKLLGVERTRAEAGLITKAQLEQFGPNKSDVIIDRETFIASHLDELLEAGESRIAVLYGSKHCAKYATPNFGYTAPFYRLLTDRYDQEKKLKAVHVVTKDDRKNLLRLYASEFEMLDEDIVIDGLSGINPKDYNYNQGLMNIFNTYDAVILEAK